MCWLIYMILTRKCTVKIHFFLGMGDSITQRFPTFSVPGTLSISVIFFFTVTSGQRKHLNVLFIKCLGRNSLIVCLCGVWQLLLGFSQNSKTFHWVPMGLLGALIQSLGTITVPVLGSSEKFKGVVYIISFHLSLFVRPWPHNLAFQLHTAKWASLAYDCGVENKRTRQGSLFRV